MHTITGSGYAGCDVVSDSENPSTRRDATVLHFMCEWGHLFDLYFVQHKGYTLASIENVQDDPEWGKPIQPALRVVQP
jgi:hypothetical protein